MFAYCRNEPVFRKDTHGTDDVCVTNFDDDNNPLNDLGKSPSGGSNPRAGNANGVNSNAKNGRASSTGTTVYRWHCTDKTKLVPSERDFNENSPMSLSTKYRPGSAMTTIEKINSTGYLHAVQDGPTHVSVYPIGGTIAEWYRWGPASIWTRALESIVTYLD